MAKGFGSIPIKKWHITKAPKESKAFELAIEKERENSNLHSKYYWVSILHFVAIIAKSDNIEMELVFAVCDQENGCKPRPLGRL